MDHRCPYCAKSLRFRWMKWIDVPRPSWDSPRITYKRCPYCHGAIRELIHPAFADDWLWMRYLSPGLGLYILAMVFSYPPLMVLATVVLIAGFFWSIWYTLRERLRWARFEAFDPDGLRDTPTDSSS